MIISRNAQGVTIGVMLIWRAHKRNGDWEVIERLGVAELALAPNDTEPVPERPWALTTEELAARWALSVGTLNNRRSLGTEVVPWLRVGRRVLYPLAEVEAYETDQLAKCGAAA